MKEQAYNMIKNKDSRTQRQSNLNKSKEARFKISPQEFEDHIRGDYNSSETKLQGRLLESFQEDAKYEHVGQDTRSKGGKDDQDIQGKDLKISKSKTMSKDNDKG
nr:hypothetical protein [Tanacetum cinerariifolium]